MNYGRERFQLYIYHAVVENFTCKWAYCCKPNKACVVLGNYQYSLALDLGDRGHVELLDTLDINFKGGRA